MKRLFSVLALGLAASNLLMAQDIHFSQYLLSPLTLNPANTGNSGSDYRFFGNYRSQWRGIERAYNTCSAGGDIIHYYSGFQAGGGLVFINDRSGINLNVNKIFPSVAVHRAVGRTKLSFGIQPGMVIKSIDFNAHTFPDQLNWSTGKFDNSLPNYETGVQQRSAYFDLNGGLLVTRRIGDLEAQAGFSMFHINQPRESLLQGASHLQPRSAINVLVNYYTGKSIILTAHSVYGSTTRVGDWVSGVNVAYVLKRDAFFTNSVYAGAMWRSGIKRNSDASIFTAGVNYRHYTVGFSFDLTNSRLKTAVDSRGAYEIAVIYRSGSTHISKKAIPCERY